MKRPIDKVPGWMIAVIGWGLFHAAAARAQAPPFEKQELNLSGRLRHLTLEAVYSPGKRDLVCVEREGTYPDWKTRLSIWSVAGRGSAPARRAEIVLPPDAVFFGFLPAGAGGETGLLALVRPRSLEIWRDRGGKWAPDPERVRSVASAFSVAELGDVTPFRPLLDPAAPVGERVLLVPEASGVASYRLGPDRLDPGPVYDVPPKAHYRSSEEQLPLELPFWLRGASWYPQAAVGSLTGRGRELFWPWMDEARVTPLEGGKAARALLFHRFTEEERDDATGYATTVAEDLNGDGRTDFVVNKFQGAATSLRGETTVFLTRPDGSVPAEGKLLAPQGNRAGGAVVVDWDRDGRKDLVVASAQFNVWSIVRALVRHRAEVRFSFYKGRPDGYRYDKPDFQREVSFRFNLADAQIEGLFPTLDGDFNGDGLPDALYAEDRQSISIMLQRRGQAEPFTEYPNATMAVRVPRQMRVADLDGDGRSDIVLYDTRASGEGGNRKVSVLLNRGVLN